MHRPILSLCLLLFSLTCGSLFAASQPDRISGTVTDPAGAPLPRVTVELRNPAGTKLAVKLTDNAGHFLFSGLEPGAYYDLVLEFTGFQRTIIRIQSRTDIVVKLAVAPVRERVVVTATRTEAPTSQVGSSTTVIASEDLEARQAALSSDLLRVVPGLAVVRSGGLGTTTSLFLRGGESDHTKVLLDGIVLNEPGGFFDFTNFSAENLERIEVVRGPQSALFGTDPLAGVIQLFTRRGRAETPRPNFAVSFEGGNQDTWRGRASVSGQVNEFDYTFSAARLNTDNLEPNNAFRNTTLAGNFGWLPEESTWLRLILRGELGTVGTPGQTAFGRPDSDAFLRRRDADFGLTLQNQTTPTWEQRLSYTLAKSRQVSRNNFRDPAFTPEFEGSASPFLFVDCLFDFLNDTRRHHLSYQSNWQPGAVAGGRHLLTFAFEWDREQGLLAERRGDDFCFSDPGGTRAERDNFGWVAQHQIFWGRFFLTFGGRIEDNDSFGTSAVPRVSVAYLAQPGGAAIGATKLKFNFGLGIKEPSLIESFSPVAAFRGNPDLAPERTRSFDFGVEQRFWGDRAKLEVNWFDNRFRDLVAFQVISFFPVFQGTFQNLGRTKAKGAEVISELAPARGLRVTGSYTFLDSQVTRSASLDPVFAAGARLFRRPKHSGSLGVAWDWRELTVSSTAFFVGRRADSDFALLGLTENDGYTRWDAAASYRGPHRITYFGAVENLLNERYMEALGFPALKFNARLGARVEF